MQQVKKKKTVFEKKNEIKFNALLFVIQPIELSYERILTNDSGIGGSIYINREEYSGIKYSATAFYRTYFGKKIASGFFIEGFGMVNNGDIDNYYFNEDISERSDNRLRGTYTDLALGFSLGAKWVHRKNIYLEITGGIGRNLFTDISPEVVGRGGIIIGYRF